MAQMVRIALTVQGNNFTHESHAVDNYRQYDPPCANNDASHATVSPSCFSALAINECVYLRISIFKDADNRRHCGQLEQVGSQVTCESDA